MLTRSARTPHQSERRRARAPVTWLVVALTIAAGPRVQAQAARLDSLLVAGARVAFRTWETDSADGEMSRRTDGIVVAHDREALQVRLNKSRALVTVPMSRIARLDVAGEPDRHPAVGALVGLLVGAATGLISGDPCAITCTAGGPANRAERTQQGALIGGALGALAGGFVGYNITTRSWSRVIPARAAALATPAARPPGSAPAPPSLPPATPPE